ncbi:MAG: hypothetical protein KC592_05285, partial [Nitrospira sp.]|nr:hypothetical protein [Nitrospira sp.]
MSENESGLPDKYWGLRPSMEFWVDFLGALMPGTMFCVSILIALIPPFYSFNLALFTINCSLTPSKSLITPSMPPLKKNETNTLSKNDAASDLTPKIQEAPVLSPSKQGINSVLPKEKLEKITTYENSNFKMQTAPMGDKGDKLKSCSPQALTVQLKELLIATQDTPSALWIGIIIVGLFLAFVVGHMFYRQDPKNPDQASLKRLIKNDSKFKSLKERKNNLACSGTE